MTDNSPSSNPSVPADQYSPARMEAAAERAARRPNPGELKRGMHFAIFDLLIDTQAGPAGPFPIALEEGDRKGRPIGPDRPHGRMPGIFKRIL